MKQPVLLAVDPSLTSSGYAIFGIHSQTLLQCGVVQTGAGENLADRIRALAIFLRDMPYSVEAIVGEWPEVYFKTKRCNPNTLFGLAGVLGAIVGTYPNARATFVLPRQWTGQQVKHDRNDAYRSLLTSDELAVLRLAAPRPCPHPPGHSGKCSGSENDVMDAISLGKWWHVNASSFSSQIAP
jgi:hypothetical protein